jgi:hypothetical protein
MNKTLPIVLASLFLMTGCSFLSTPVKTIEVDAAPIERAPLTLPDVDKLTSRTVKWIIVTPDNVNEVFAKLEKDGTDLALFAITDNGYENLSLNMADIIKLIKQQQSIIAAYKNYYEGEQ